MRGARELCLLVNGPNRRIGRHLDRRGLDHRGRGWRGWPRRGFDRVRRGDGRRGPGFGPQGRSVAHTWVVAGTPALAGAHALAGAPRSGATMTPVPLPAGALPVLRWRPLPVLARPQVAAWAADCAQRRHSGRSIWTHGPAAACGGWCSSRRRSPSRPPGVRSAPWRHPHVQGDLRGVRCCGASVPTFDRTATAAVASAARRGPLGRLGVGCGGASGRRFAPPLCSWPVRRPARAARLPAGAGGGACRDRRRARAVALGRALADGGRFGVQLAGWRDRPGGGRGWRSASVRRTVPSCRKVPSCQTEPSCQTVPSCPTVPSRALQRRQASSEPSLEDH